MKPIHEEMQKQGLEFVTRTHERILWNKVWSDMPYQPVNHAVEMIDYEHEYFKGAGWDVGDASLIFLHGGNPVGLWVLTDGRRDGEPSLTSCGQPIFAPVFLSSVSQKIKKRLCAKAVSCFAEYQRNFQIRELLFQQDHQPENGANSVSEWHRQIILAGATTSLKYMLYADISQSMDVIRASFRKSYKPLINRARREWGVFVMDTINTKRDIWQEFQDLHFQVSGRKTRSQLSWDIQFEMIASGRGFLVGLRSQEDNRLVGGGFFQYTRDEALYSVGVYDRTLFDRPLGHGVQGCAIEYMKALGLRRYKIGEWHFLQDESAPTEKEVSISVFKEGFASDMNVVFLFRLSSQPS